MDEEPQTQPRRLIEPKPLDSLGIGELRDYIAALQTEIARAQATIDRKASHRGAAEAVFAKK